tara:strand:- start:231 stop:521 length:291 start_codon:yes stop_codon:yes gene_type:complete
LRFEREKKLAALDFSTYGKNKFRKKCNKPFINEVIKYCNYKNIVVFVERTFDIVLEPTKIKTMFTNVQDIIDKMNVTLEDVNKHSNIVLLETIPTI